MVEQANAGLYRLGSTSALAIAGAYVVITGLYVTVGAVPTGGEAWLAYLAPQTTAWWAIAGLSVLTDLLFLPLALALYRALRGTADTPLLVGAGLLALFAILDLCITWPNYAALLTLSTDYGSAGEIQRKTLAIAATYPSAILSSSLFAAYAILVPAVGIAAIGAVQLRAGIGRFVAYVAVATGACGVIAVVGPVVVPALGLVAIPASILTTVWLVLVGLSLRDLS